MSKRQRRDSIDRSLRCDAQCRHEGGIGPPTSSAMDLVGSRETVDRPGADEIESREGDGRWRGSSVALTTR